MRRGSTTVRVACHASYEVHDCQKPRTETDTLCKARALTRTGDDWPANPEMPGMTRDDHPNVSDQLYANYAIGQVTASLGFSPKLLDLLSPVTLVILGLEARPHPRRTPVRVRIVQ